MAPSSYAVGTQHDHPAVQQLAACIAYLRSVCDGAQSRDYQGFSAFDKNLGHYLADQLANHQGWSQPDLGYAVQIAWRYREQLYRAGLAFPLAADLAAELGGLDPSAQVAVQPTVSTASVSLWRDEGWICLAFSHYDHAKLAQLMSTVPVADRWWDEDRVRWLVQAHHEGALVALYGVAVGAAPLGQVPVAIPAAQVRPSPVRSAPAGVVTISDYDADHIAVRCPFDQKDQLKDAVPWQHRSWNGTTKSWIVARAFQPAVEAALGVGFHA